MTQLILAIIERDNEEVIKLINAPECDFAQQDEHGNPALLLAVLYNRPVVLSAMLQHPRVDVNIKSATTGITALMLACQQEREEMIKLLLAHPDCDVNIQDNSGNSALSFAQEHNCRVLLEDFQGRIQSEPDHVKEDVNFRALHNHGDDKYELGIGLTGDDIDLHGAGKWGCDIF
jgi:ankyrin repeat protein